MAVRNESIKSRLKALEAQSPKPSAEFECKIAAVDCDGADQFFTRAGLNGVRGASNLEIASEARDTAVAVAKLAKEAEHEAAKLGKKAFGGRAGERYDPYQGYEIVDMDAAKAANEVEKDAAKAGELAYRSAWATQQAAAAAAGVPSPGERASTAAELKDAAAAVKEAQDAQVAALDAAGKAHFEVPEIPPASFPARVLGGLLEMLTPGDHND